MSETQGQGWLARWREATATAPTALRGAVMGLLFVALRYVAPGESGSKTVVGSILGGVVCGAWWAWFLESQRRNDLEAMGPAAALDHTVAERSVRTGVLPESDARDELTRRLVEHRRRQCRRAGHVAAALAIGAVLAVGFALVGHDVSWMAPSVAALLFAVGLRWWTHQDLARYDRLERELDARAAAR